MLCARRRTLRLVEAQARAARDAGRSRHAGRLGHGHRDLSGTDVPGAGARRRAARWIRRDGNRRSRHGAGRVDRVRPDRSRRTWARSRPGRVQVRHVGPAGCGHCRRLGPYRDRWHGDPQCRRRRDRKARRSCHRRRALAFVRGRQCRGDRAWWPSVPSRRRDAQRKLCRYPRPRGSQRDRSQWQRCGRSCGAIELRNACARRGLRRGQGRSRSGPDPRHPHGRRVRRRPHHQSPHGPQPAVRRHDLGHVVCAARRGRDGPSLGADH